MSEHVLCNACGRSYRARKDGLPHGHGPPDTECKSPTNPGQKLMHPTQFQLWPEMSPVLIVSADGPRSVITWNDHSSKWELLDAVQWSQVHASFSRSALIGWWQRGERFTFKRLENPADAMTDQQLLDAVSERMAR